MSEPKIIIPKKHTNSPVSEAEEALMKAATEFAYIWGRDQTVHPKMTWLELHLENWRKLAIASVEYATAIEQARRELR